MAKDPKRELRRVKYRVVKKAFVNGSLHEPGAIVEADEGLEGRGLERMDEAPSVSPSQDGNVKKG